MEKILEVLRYGENDIRFNTDFDPVKNPGKFTYLLMEVSLTMATKLWGGNEQAVMAVIRLLSVADLSLCINRKEMINKLDAESALLAKSFREAMRAFKKGGGKVQVFAPWIKPSKKGSCS